MKALDFVARYSSLILDSADYLNLTSYDVDSVTTNPSIVATTALAPEYADFLLQLKLNNKFYLDAGQLDAIRVAVALGHALTESVSGDVYTQVDPRFAYDTQANVLAAKQLLEFYQELGVNHERVVIKIPATWQGIKAAEVLQQQGVRCCMTMVFTLIQAVACADAKVYQIAPFVGRIANWYCERNIENRGCDYGVESVLTMYKYYQFSDYETNILACPSTVRQALGLAGVSAMTVSPELYRELGEHEMLDKQQPLTSCLSESIQKKIEVNEKLFTKVLEQDEMFQTLLTQAIAGFIAATTKLEEGIIQRFNEEHYFAEPWRVAV